MSESILKRFIRQGGHPIGCVVAVKHTVNNEEVIDFGYSLCNKVDHFSKKRGTKIAIGRALSGFDTDVIPDDRYEETIGELYQMAARASLYYKVELEFQESEPFNKEVLEGIDFLEEVEV